MISVTDMRNIARARLRDAQVLMKAGRYDGATYLCGYVVEIALKARVCRTLRLTGFPEVNAEFQHLAFLKTHDFITLLKLSGQEHRVVTTYLAEWSTITKWEPETRYKIVGTATAASTQAIVDSARTLMRALL